jgi:hypothetical protein
VFVVGIGGDGSHLSHADAINAANIHTGARMGGNLREFPLSDKGSANRP